MDIGKLIVLAVLIVLPISFSYILRCYKQPTSYMLRSMA